MSYQDYQNYKNARDAAWRILIDCNINRLPVNLNLICKALKIRVLSYGDASHLNKIASTVKHHRQHGRIDILCGECTGYSV